MNLDIFDAIKMESDHECLCLLADSSNGLRFLCALRFVKAWGGPLYKFSGTLLDTRGLWIWNNEVNEFVESREPPKQFHETLRRWLLVCCSEVLEHGCLVAGSYEYEGQMWDVKLDNVESVDLPDGFDIS